MRRIVLYLAFVAGALFYGRAYCRQADLQYTYRQEITADTFAEYYERRHNFSRAIGVPEAGQITECESFSTLLTLLAGSDMLAVVQHPFLDMPQVAQVIQEIPITQRLPGLTVGLHTRADAPLTKPAAALARLLSEIGRKLLQRGHFS